MLQYAALRAARTSSRSSRASAAPSPPTLSTASNEVYRSGRVIEAGCNAHGSRKFRDAEDAQPDLAKEGGAFVAAMYVAEEAAKKAGLEGMSCASTDRRISALWQTASRSGSRPSSQRYCPPTS